MTEKQEQPKKSILKKWWFWVLIFFFCVFLASNMDWTPATNTPTQQQEIKKDVVQERMDHITELMKAEVPEFEKVEKIEDNVIWIFFTSTPDLWIEDTIDSTTRWQARNLSLDVNGVASVKTFVWWNAVMYCTATKWQVNDCMDYR